MEREVLSRSAALTLPRTLIWVHKLSEPTTYAWRKHFGTMEAADVKRLKVLELENSRLKKLLAEAALDIEVLREINAKKW